MVLQRRRRHALDNVVVQFIERNRRIAAGIRLTAQAAAQPVSKQAVLQTGRLVTLLAGTTTRECIEVLDTLEHLDNQGIRHTGIRMTGIEQANARTGRTGLQFPSQCRERNARLAEIGRVAVLGGQIAGHVPTHARNDSMTRKEEDHGIVIGGVPAVRLINALKAERTLAMVGDTTASSP